MAEYKETLRSLALNDERFVESALAIGNDTLDISGLDQKTQALVRLGASLALDAAASSYHSNVEMALAAGASIDEIVGTLIAVAPIVGLVRTVSAAPNSPSRSATTSTPHSKPPTQTTPNNPPAAHRAPEPIHRFRDAQVSLGTWGTG